MTLTIAWWARWNTLWFRLMAKSLTVIVSVFIAATLAMKNLKKKQKIDDEKEYKTQPFLYVLPGVTLICQMLGNHVQHKRRFTGMLRGFSVQRVAMWKKLMKGLFLICTGCLVKWMRRRGRLGFRNLAYIQHMFEKYNQWVRLYGDLTQK